MKQETELKQAFIREYREQNPEAHIVPIESNLTHQGIPDLNICDDVEFWVEFKWGEGELKPLQISWSKQRRDAGGLVFLIIQDKETSFTVCANYSMRHCGSIKRVVDFVSSYVKLEWEKNE